MVLPTLHLIPCSAKYPEYLAVQQRESRASLDSVGIVLPVLRVKGFGIPGLFLSDAPKFRSSLDKKTTFLSFVSILRNLSLADRVLNFCFLFTKISTNNLF